MIAGLAPPIPVGFAGLGVEVGLWLMHSHKLQSATDMAAWAGAYGLNDGLGDTRSIGGGTYWP